MEMYAIAWPVEAARHEDVNWVERQGQAPTAGLTQRALGKRLGKPQSWVFNCETANRVWT
jgi:hypothetical protein